MSDFIPLPNIKMKRIFWALVLLNLLFILWAYNFLSPLRSREMVRFEVAKTIDEANAIKSDWVIRSLYDKAITSVYIDYIFILLYSAALAVSCIYVSRLTRHEILTKAGKLFSILVIAAGTCDVIENIGILQSLKLAPSHWSVSLTYDMAVTKFSLLILSFLFLLVCFFYFILDRDK